MPDDAPYADPLTDGTLRIPPHSIEAEQSVLGGLMLDPSAMERLPDPLIEADFYRRNHRLIWRALRALTDAGQPCDVVTVSEWLERRQQLDDAGGLAYLAALANNTPSAANVGAYAGIVRERAVLRQLLGAATDIADSVYRPDGRAAGQLLDEAESRVLGIAEQHAGGQGAQPIRQVLTAVVDRIEQLYQSDSPVTGLRTGWTDLDERTAGLQSGDLIIVAGRPSMGKTAFAMGMAEHVGLAGGKVAVFSMEMPAEQLGMRLLASIGRIDQQRLRTGRLKDEDWPRLTAAINHLHTASIQIDDSPALSPAEVRARARRIKREMGGLDLVVVDYLQLMRAGGDNRTAEVSEISRGLKALAKELHVPVVALSQLNRNLEQRTNKRPVMSDLRESGSIEQDADVIAFVYRDEVYNPDSPTKGTAEIILGKQRNGPIGTVHMAFLGAFTRFEDLAPGAMWGGE